MARDRNYKTVSTDDSASFHPEVLTMAKMMIVRRTLNGDWLVPVYWNVTYKVLYRKRSDGLIKLPRLVSWLVPLNSCGDIWFAQKNHWNLLSIWFFVRKITLTNKNMKNIQTTPLKPFWIQPIPPTFTPGFQRERLRRRKRSRWNLDEAWWLGGEGRFRGKGMTGFLKMYEDDILNILCG